MEFVSQSNLFMLPKKLSKKQPTKSVGGYSGQKADDDDVHFVWIRISTKLAANNVRKISREHLIPAYICKMCLIVHLKKYKVPIVALRKTGISESTSCKMKGRCKSTGFKKILAPSLA